MCLCDAKLKKRMQAKVFNEQKTAETLQQLNEIAKKAGLTVEKVAITTQFDRELKPNTNFATKSINQISRLKGIYA